MAKKIVIVLLVLGLVFYFRGCFAGMPAVMPADFKLEFSTGGGMLDRSSNLHLSAQGGTLEKRYDGTETKIEFTVSPDELNALYQVLRKYSFPRIRTNGSEIHDKGGYAVSAHWDDSHYSVGTSGTDISFFWRRQWDNIVACLSEYQRKIEQQKNAESLH